MKKKPPLSPPTPQQTKRWVTQEEAANHVSMSVNTFKKKVLPMLHPSVIECITRFDIQELDAIMESLKTGSISSIGTTKILHLKKV